VIKTESYIIFGSLSKANSSLVREHDKKKASISLFLMIVKKNTNSLSLTESDNAQKPFKIITIYSVPFPGNCNKCTNLYIRSKCIVKSCKSKVCRLTQKWRFHSSYCPFKRSQHRPTASVACMMCMDKNSKAGLNSPTYWTKMLASFEQHTSVE
jgi:hypothetical protein